MDWRDRLAARTAALLGVATFRYGSTVSGEVDAASDLDLVAVVDDPTWWAPIARLDGLGSRWAWQSHHDDGEVVHRVVFTDGGWLDLKLIGSPQQLPLVAVPVDPDDVIGDEPENSHQTDQLDEQVVRARFLAALAATKFVRDDQLIGGHLLLDLARVALETAMVHRDQLVGTNQHRFGGPLNQVWTEVLSSLPQPGAPLAAQLDCLPGLVELVEHGRAQPSDIAAWKALRARLGA